MILDNIKNLLNPVPAIGGLEISDLVLRFAVIENGNLKQASVQLPPGLITNGKVQDKAKVVVGLKALHQQIAPLNKIIHVIALIPSDDIYTQALAMPLVAEKNLRETAELNLRMVSPIDIKSSYYSYQILGENQQGQLEILGAFANSASVEELIGLLKEANFSTIAVEFSSLSLTRVIKEYAAGLKQDVPYLVINLSSDGPDLTIMKNGNLYFSLFKSWSSLQKEIGGRKLTSQDVQDFLISHVKQILNFYSSRWGASVTEVLLISTPISKEITQAVKVSFGLNVQVLTIMKFGQLSPLWYGVLGAALRGQLPRSKDRLITLTAVGVEEEYFRESTIRFIKSWRNVIADIADLQARVKLFNNSVDLVAKIQEDTVPWSPLFVKLRTLAAEQVTLERVSVDPSLNTLLSGRAVSDTAVISFKNKMIEESNFKDVVLPLSNIKANTDGTVSFILNFKITSLKF
ncbi:MAG: hypothetical protein UY12_C0026G0016 [Parcubacteria group bacterium GW2011_GWA2_47_8b]|nr:MAG: hypothetical protein UY12_C0026G0016 [Parcubacteria group bacterium GW2011_GWA2_47_8b]